MSELPIEIQIPHSFGGETTEYLRPVSPLVRPSTPTSAQTITECLEQFHSWLSASSAQPSSRRIYLSRIKIFNEFLCAHQLTHLPAESLSQVLHSFLTYGKESLGFRPHTTNNYLSTFRLYSKLSGQKLDGLDYEQIMPVEPRRLTAAEKENYIAQSYKSKSTREPVLALLFLTTGVSLGESVNLTLSDVVALGDSLQLKVHSRSGVRRESVDNRLRQSLEAWLLERTTLGSGSDCHYLFFNANGGKLSTDAIDVSLRKIGWKAGLNVSVRVLSNTYKLGPLT